MVESKLHKTIKDFIRCLLTYDKMVKLGTPATLLSGYWLDVLSQLDKFETVKEFKAVPVTFRQLYAEYCILIEQISYIGD